MEGEWSTTLAPATKRTLREMLANSLRTTPTGSTPRRLVGPWRVANRASVITGMRRIGKTTLLHQLRAEHLHAAGEAGDVPFVNFEDERLAGIKATHLGFLLDEYLRMPRSDPSRALWSFDEIQAVDGWERFVRRLLDDGLLVQVTGSSSALLSREIATALRGRAWSVALFAFSFAEALAHRGMSVPTTLRALMTHERAEIEAELEFWLRAGGFPEAQDADEHVRRQMLRDYVDVAMLRDVVERHSVTNVTALRWIVRHLMGNAASTFSVEKLYRALRSQGVAVSKNTVHELVGYLEESYLVRLVWMESASERQRMVNPRKIYPVDQGLIPVYDRTGRANVGHALETAVMIELERRRCEVTYVKTASNYEVDFLARAPDGSQELIQVCADASEASTADRELRALVEAVEQYSAATPRLLVLRRDGMPPESPEGVSVMTAAEWLLREPGQVVIGA